jgi:hypothetical protein
MRIFASISTIAVIMMYSMGVSAEAPRPEAASVDVLVDIGGTILNGGVGIGGDALVETSIATYHGGRVGGEVNIDVELVNYGIAVANGGLVLGGNLCSKVSIGSIGANTCANDLTSLPGTP